MKARFLAIVGLLAGALITAYAISTFDQYRQNNSVEGEENHFSVRWMGFAPADYSNQYPNYCIDINDLKDSTLKMQIALQLKNQESNPYYFLIDNYGLPPANWTITPYKIGLIGVGATSQFVYSNISRTKPTSISMGLLTENASLVVKAYSDASYSNFYSQDNFNVTFNFIDRTAPVWSQLHHDNFDDATTQQWSAQGSNSPSVSASTEYYRSFQYSLKLAQGRYASNAHEAALKKSFSVSSSFTEAYLIFSIRSQSWAADQFKIVINGTTYFRSDIQPSTNRWYRFAIPLQTGKVSIVELWCLPNTTAWTYYYAYLDDVYVIAR